MSLLHSLRARLFAAIAVIVALLGRASRSCLGLVLTRRAVEDATLKDLGHQAALIVGEERNALSPLTHLPRAAAVPRAPARALPARHRRALARRAATSSRPAGQVATGTRHDRRHRLTTSRPSRSAGAPSSCCGRRASTDHALDAVRGGDRDRRARRRRARRGRRVLPGAADRAARRARRGGERGACRRPRPGPVPVEGAAELETLAVAFNDLAEQLARAREAERSFLLSVSHELKTPLTAIRATPRRCARARSRRTTRPRRSPREAERLGRLVGDLLDLGADEPHRVHRPPDRDRPRARSPRTRSGGTSRRRMPSACRSRRLGRPGAGDVRTPTASSRSSRTWSRTRCA